MEFDVVIVAVTRQSRKLVSLGLELYNYGVQFGYHGPLLIAGSLIISVPELRPRPRRGCGCQLPPWTPQLGTYR